MEGNYVSFQSSYIIAMVASELKVPSTHHIGERVLSEAEGISWHPFSHSALVFSQPFFITYNLKM